MSFSTGTKVVCIDDQGWLEPDAYQGPAPVKGEIYTINKMCHFGSALAVTLVEFPEAEKIGFYRACRFRPVQLVTHPPIQLARDCGVDNGVGVG